MLPRDARPPNYLSERKNMRRTYGHAGFKQPSTVASWIHVKKGKPVPKVDRMKAQAARLEQHPDSKRLKKIKGISDSDIRRAQRRKDRRAEDRELLRKKGENIAEYTKRLKDMYHYDDGLDNE